MDADPVISLIFYIETANALWERHAHDQQDRGTHVHYVLPRHLLYLHRHAIYLFIKSFQYAMTSMYFALC